MFFKRLVAVKDGGRKTLFSQDNLLALIFIILVIVFSLVLNYKIFAYFTLGALVARLFEIIFEFKDNILEEPFLNYMVIIGIPAQFLWFIYH